MKTLKATLPLGIFIIASILALVFSLIYGKAAVERVLLDPGALVRWALPVTKLVLNISISVLLAALMFAIGILSPKTRNYSYVMNCAAFASIIYSISAFLVILFTFIDISGLKFSVAEDFSAAFAQFVFNIELGQNWLVVLVLALIVSSLCLAVRDQRIVLFVFVLALASLFPLANMGHSAGATGHNQAVNAMLVHLLASALWLGGVLILVLLAFRMSLEEFVVVLKRYSMLAGICFTLVAFSGLISAFIRVGSIPNLLTSYGFLLGVKTFLLLVLGILGFFMRRWVIKSSKNIFYKKFSFLILIEIATMGAVSGVAAGIARTAPPVSENIVSDALTASPAEILTTSPLPSELTSAQYFSSWSIDAIWFSIGVGAIIFYLAAVIILIRRGDKWPVHRILLWVSGQLLLIYATNGVFKVYEQYLFSIHMLGHMLLTMAIPALMVFGAPVTLISRVLKKRQDGSRGLREWVLWAVHTPWANFISSPLIAAAIFALSLWAFYYTEIFRWAITQHLGHQWMIIHFLMSGYLFAQALVGIDPVKHRISYPFRLILLIATMAFHTFFGLMLLTGDNLLLADWYGSMGRTWGEPPLQDQQTGGGIAWAIGEVPTVILAIAVAVLWSKSDTRLAKRLDRNADRTEEAELRAYNQMLQQRGQSRF